MIGRWGRAACFAITMSACSLGFDGEEYQGDVGGGPAGPCSADALYAPSVPEGWQGPVQMASALDEAALPACPSVSSVLHVGLTPNAFECGCSCTTDTTSKCTADVNLFLYGSGCSGQTQPVSLTADTCLEISSGGFASGDVYWKPSGDPCVGMAIPQAQPSVAWSAHTLLCAATATQIADGRVCAAPHAGFDPVLCIYAEGEGECPSEFPVRHQHHGDYLDDRNCEACSCTGATCGGFIQVSPDDLDCDSSNVEIAARECLSVSAPSGDVSGMYVSEAVGQCTPSSSQASGEAVPTDPVVVCCTS